MQEQDQNDQAPEVIARGADHTMESSRSAHLTSTQRDDDELRPINKEDADRFWWFFSAALPKDYKLDNFYEFLASHLSEPESEDFSLLFKGKHLSPRILLKIRDRDLIWDIRIDSQINLGQHYDHLMKHIKDLIPKPMVKLEPEGGFYVYSQDQIPKEASGFAYGLTRKGYPKRLEGDVIVSGAKSTFYQGQVWMLSPTYIDNSYRSREYYPVFINDDGPARVDYVPAFVLSLQTAAFLNSILEYFVPNEEKKNQPLPWFLFSFLSSSIETDSLYNPFPATKMLQYRVQYFTPDDHPWYSATVQNDIIKLNLISPYSYKREGFILNRQMAKLRKGDKYIHFSEKVSSLCLITEGTTRSLYILLVLEDDRLHRAVLDDSTWKEHGLVPCKGGTGFIQLLAMILSVLKKWEVGWMSTLDKIDLIARVQLNDLLEEESWLPLMFDDSFTLSKNYFSILQLLRIIDDWAELVDQHLKLLKDKFFSPSLSGHLATEDLQVLMKNWDKVEDVMRRRKKAVQDRAARKAEEIKSLRDGLFNATSLRESTKSMALDRSIYVFTIITVIYTPVGFLATFWALPFLNNPSENDVIPEPTAFRSTFIVVPILTYGIAITLALCFNSKTSQNLVRSSKRRFFKTIKSLATVLSGS